MVTINAQDRTRIADAVAVAEKQTAVELKLVLAPVASHYGAFALIYPAVLALLLGGVIALAWPGTSARAMLALQVLCFALLCGLLQIRALRAALAPSAVKRKAAVRLARLQFARLGLDTEAGRPALLFFVAQAERYVEILVDARVAARVSQATFDGIVARFSAAARTGQLSDAFVEACAEIGNALAVSFPAQPNAQSERSDEIDIVEPH